LSERRADPFKQPAKRSDSREAPVIRRHRYRSDKLMFIQSVMLATAQS
jgi:hypothetical protein